MNSTGTLRTIDELGRVALPAEVRSRFGLRERDAVEIFADESGIYLKPQDTERCAFCMAKDTLLPHGGGYLCKACLSAINERIRAAGADMGK